MKAVVVVSTPAGTSQAACNYVAGTLTHPAHNRPYVDRIGRNAMNVRVTLESLTHTEIRVHCLARGGADMSSPASKMTMDVVAAGVEFERDQREAPPPKAGCCTSFMCW
jgi:hypothetical protein